MAEQQTCGMGLAENSPLPGTLSEVIAAIAENLEAHMTALDADDEASRNELKAYEELSTGHREIAERLKAVAREMAGYRDLPMGKHDQKKLGGGEAGKAFERLVQREQDLLELLTDKIDRERKMLGEVSKESGKPSERSREASKELGEASHEAEKSG